MTSGVFLTDALFVSGPLLPVLPEEVGARCSHLRRGWYWGSQEFAEKLRKLSDKLLKQRGNPSRSYKRTPETRIHIESQAEKWLKQGLRAAGLKAGDRCAYATLDLSSFAA
jgi:hypothetical protein